MKVVNQYIIPFRGLKEGKHSFNFQIDKEFFEENAALDIPNGTLNVDVELTKKSTFLMLDVIIQGQIELICDRCLDTFPFQVDSVDQLFVKFKEEPEEPDDKVIFLHPSDDILNLNQYFYDCIGLSIPIQKIHSSGKKGKSDCNKEMLSIINAHTSKIVEDEENDPRWSKLKNLLNDGNKTE